MPTTASPTPTSWRAQPGDHRRPAAHRRQLALDGRHRHRRVQMLRVLFAALAEPRAGIAEPLLLQRPARHVPRVRGHRAGRGDGRGRADRPEQVAQRGRDRLPKDFDRRSLVVGDLRQLRLLRHRQADQGVHRRRSATTSSTSTTGARSRSDKTVNLTYEGVVAKLKKPGSARSPTRCSRTCARRVRPDLRRTQALPGVRRRRASTRRRSRQRLDGKNIAELLRACRSPTSRRSCARIDAPRSRRCSTRSPRGSSTSSASGSATCSLDRDARRCRAARASACKMVRHLGSSLTDITYVFDEPSVGLHPHDVHRLAGLLQRAPRQGQHGARRRAQAGHDRDRRPRRRHGPGRRPRRRRDRLRGRLRRPAQVRHADRQPHRQAPADQDRAAQGRRRDRRSAARPGNNLKDVSRRHPARRADGRHRRRRLRQVHR